MAVAVGSWAQTTRGTGTSKSQSATWATDNLIVVGGGAENALATLGTPTATGLTFTLRQSLTAGGGNACPAYMWTAKATGSDTQNISITRGGSSLSWGFDVWVLTGADAYVSGYASSATTANGPALTAQANGGVVAFISDWDANNTDQAASTGSGTPTERSDARDATNWAWWTGDWMNTASGSFNFGLQAYTGMTPAGVAIVVSAAAGGATDRPMRRRRSGLYVPVHAPWRP